MFNFLTLSKYKKLCDQKQNELTQLDQQYQILLKQKNEMLSEINKLKKQLTESSNIIEMQELGMDYTPISDDSNKLLLMLNDVQKQIANLIASDECCVITKIYKINNSEQKGAQFQRNYCSNLLIGFNTYFANKEKSLTVYNYERIVDLLTKSFVKYNNKGKLIGISISYKYLHLRLKELKIKLDIKIAKDKEKEKIKLEKQQLKEQEKLLIEAEKEKQKLENERKAMDLAFNRALNEEERNQILNELQRIDKRLSDIDYRINNQKAGYLYIISSPSLPGLIKIGCTRRLNPMVRVKELSSSSLPFPFEAHGFVFSDNVFELEANMHRYFNRQRINPDKEFFEISPKEAIQVLIDHFHCEIHFNTEEVNDNDS